jgi:agmatinase
MLLNFAQPSTVEQVLRHPDDQKAMPALVMLFQKGFLVSEDEAGNGTERFQRSVSMTPYTLFHCPRSRPDSTANDIGVLGVPYDLGNTFAGGAREAPNELRRRSNDYSYRIDVSTGEPMGWYDVERASRILQGITIADWGDVWFEYGENAEAIFDRVSAVVRQITTRGGLPVILGGDHSVSYPVIRELQGSQEVFVIWLDAHTDSAALLPGASHNNANVVTRLLTLQNVAGVLQVGQRGYTVHDKVHVEGPRQSIVSGEIRQRGAAVVLNRIPEDALCYISIDVSVLDPTYVPGCTAPVTGGLTCGWRIVVSPIIP